VVTGEVFLGAVCSRCGCEFISDNGIVTDERRQHKFVDHCLSALIYERNELQRKVDHQERFCQEFIWGEDNPHEYQTLQEERDSLEEENEKLKQAVRLAFYWAKQKEHWQQARDVLKGQMFEMGEL